MVMRHAVSRIDGADVAGLLRDGVRRPMEALERPTAGSRMEVISGRSLNLGEHTLQGRNEGE